MNYTAVKTKIQAMSAKLLTFHDYEELCRGAAVGVAVASLEDDFERISSYIYAKPVRNFIKTMAGNLTTNHWSYILWGKLPTLDKPNRNALRRVLGTEIDLRNILWLYRLKQFHNTQGNASLGSLIPASHRLARETLTALVNCKDAGTLTQALTKTSYRRIFTTPEDFRLGEQALSRAVRAQFRKESLTAGAVCICRYLYEKHLEVRNLHTIAQGLKFGFSPEEIFGRLC